jgi:Tfp pilus assembly protein PilF
LRAVSIDPNYAEGHASLGHYYDAVLDDPARARPYFEKAIALGDESARDGLQAVMDQLRGT